MSNRSIRGDSALDPAIGRLVNACNAHVLNWRLAHKRGKKIVDAIVAEEKTRLDDDEDGGRGGTRRRRYSHQLQENCLKLKDACQDLQDVVDALRVTCDKLQAASQLEQSYSSLNASSSTDLAPLASTSSLAAAASDLLLALSAQLQVSHRVAEDVAHCPRADDLVFLAALWTHQPLVDHKAVVAMQMLSYVASFSFFTMSVSPFRYSTRFLPISVDTPLCLLEKERPAEAALLLDALQAEAKAGRDLNAILQGPRPLSGESAWSSARQFLDECCHRNYSFGTLFDLFVGRKDGICFGLLSPMDHVLFSLKDKYQELSLMLDVDTAEISEELGATFEIGIAAVGCPTPKFQWFFLAPGATDWEYLKATGNCIRISQFEPDDCGMYRCHVGHSLPTFKAETGEELRGIYSRPVRVKVAKGSIWLRKDLPDKVETVMGDRTVMSVDALCCKDETVSFQWYHNGSRCVQKTDPNFEICSTDMSDSGEYHCVVASSSREAISSTCQLAVTVPTKERLAQMNFDNERIRILEQPSFDRTEKASIGDKISLRCLAVCKFPLKYEWLKQGVSQDLIARTKQQTTPVISVSSGENLEDVVEDSERSSISHWLYTCVVTCPATRERLATPTVKVPVCAYVASWRSLPKSKVALVLCQEKYSDKRHFHELNAPRSDGLSLAAALRQMDFDVLVLADLTLDQVRNAIELFCSFIDEESFALFYYSGHALGDPCSPQDMHLAATDSVLAADKPVSDQLIWCGEIEARIASCRPMLGVIIYDSCRDSAPESIEPIMRVEAGRRQVSVVPATSSFFYCYGTRAKMRSYEHVSGQVCQGLYMKHLLKHIASDVSVSTVFERLGDSFTKEEDQSVVNRMSPEFRHSSRQIFVLSCPLRSAKHSRNRQRFFRLLRPEYLYGDFTPEYEIKMGVSVGVTGRVDMIAGQDECGAVIHAFLDVVVAPAPFHNEAKLALVFERVAPKAAHGITFQVIGVNVDLEQTVLVRQFEHSVIARFDKCAAKTDNFVEADGPVFQSTEGTSSKLGSCTMLNLQTLSEPAKLRLVARLGGRAWPCSRFLKVPLPIVANCPRLRVENSIA